MKPNTQVKVTDSHEVFKSSSSCLRDLKQQREVEMANVFNGIQLCHVVATERSVEPSLVVFLTQLQ